MKSVLVVEDDSNLNKILASALERAGYDVTVTGTAAEGCDRFLNEVFDVFVFDVMLPDFSGRDLCRRVRQEGISTPLLILTALDATEDKVDCLKEGADDYLTKPFDFDELKARLDALIRRASGTTTEETSELRVCDLTLDPSAYTVFKGNKPIELTVKEFQLLELLMRSPNKLISRTRMLNKIWGYDAAPLTNVVDVNIRHIRAKLNWDAESGYIKTVRGYGYKLVSDDAKEGMGRLG